MSKRLTPDDMGMPIIRAFGLGGDVVSVCLRITADELPTLEVVREVRERGDESLQRGVDVAEFERALTRYRLVLEDVA